MLAPIIGPIAASNTVTLSACPLLLHDQRQPADPPQRHCPRLRRRRVSRHNDVGPRACGLGAMGWEWGRAEARRGPFRAPRGHRAKKGVAALEGLYLAYPQTGETR